MMLRPALALCLALLVALTGQAAAIARGQPVADTWIEICSGSGPVMLAVDADGQPTGTAHLCPDNAYLLVQALSAAAPDVAAPRLVARRIGAPAPVLAVVPTRTVTAPARGPPAPV